MRRQALLARLAELHAVVAYRRPMLNRATSVLQQLHSVADRVAHPLTALAASPRHAAATWRTTALRVDRPKRSGPSADPRLQRLEAVLFLSREPLSSRKLSQFANLADGTEARTLIRHLNRTYDESGRAFRVEEVAGGYQLLTRPMFSGWLRRLEHTPAEVRLSAPVMETLAVVAYRQPVARADIEAVRGVSCGEILRQLMERDLVRICGRSEDLGRPYLYGTTKRFLQMFGLRSLEQLPRADELRRDEVAAESGPAETREPVAGNSNSTVSES